MTLPDIMRSFSTDAQCRELLERLRWPEGPKCDEFGVAHDLRVGGNIKTILGQFALNLTLQHHKNVVAIVFDCVFDPDLLKCLCNYHVNLLNSGYKYV